MNDKLIKPKRKIQADSPPLRGWCLVLLSGEYSFGEIISDMDVSMWMNALQDGKLFICQLINSLYCSCLFKVVDLVKTQLIVVKAVC